jgi:hypothetical protein
MNKFKNHQRPRRKYRFNIVDHKKALKIWWDSPFKAACDAQTAKGKPRKQITSVQIPLTSHSTKRPYSTKISNCMDSKCILIYIPVTSMWTAADKFNKIL